MPTSWWGWVTPLDLRKVTRTLWSTQLLHTLARFTKQRCTGDCYSNNFTPRYRKSRNSCVHLRYLTRLTYIFLKNSSNFRRRRRQISAQAHLDFPHDSAWMNLGRDSAQICAESGESKSRTYVHGRLWNWASFVDGHDDICLEQVAKASRLLSSTQYRDLLVSRSQLRLVTMAGWLCETNNLQWLYVHSQHSQAAANRT